MGACPLRFRELRLAGEVSEPQLIGQEYSYGSKLKSVLHRLCR